MDVADRSQLQQTLNARCDAIADSWFQALARLSYVPVKLSDVRERLVGLTRQAIELLFAEPFEPAQAQGIGAALAELHYIQPEALGRTQTVLATQLVGGLPAHQLAALQPRLAALLGEVATGFFQQARAMILTEQERTREALVTTLRATETALREAHEYLEERVAERTAELRDSHENILALLNAPIDRVLIIDKDGVIVAISLVAAQALGKSAGELVGLTVYSFLPSDLAATRRSQVEAVVRTGLPIRFEDTRDGRCLDQTLYPVADSQGDVIRLVIVASDITERKRAEAALRESEERFRIVSELVSDLAYSFRIEPDGTMVPEWTTEALSRIAGFDVEELDAAHGGWMRIVPPEDQPIFRRHRQVYLSGQTDVAEYRIVTRNGEERWLRAYARPVWDEAQGRVVRLYGAMQDITERKRAEAALRESEETARALLNAPTDVMMLVTPEAVILDISETAASRFGRSVREMIGLRVLDLLPPDIAGRRLGYGERVLRSKQPIRFEDEHRGTWYDNVFYPILDAAGNVTRVAIIARDITERKQAEQALQRFATELQTRNEELDAFTHTVAHDLQGPLTLMIGYAQTVKQYYGSLPEEKIQGYLRTIAQTGYRMSNIIDELLLLASVRSQEVEPMPLDMAAILGEVQERLAYLIEDYQADISLPDTWPTALGHDTWIGEVWANYFTNALKYGGRPPFVELGSTRQPDGMVCFWVRDNGPGIAPEEQMRLFTPFTHLGQIQVKGHGLGLSIVRRIVEKLGGQVGVNSEVGRGSVFTFTLPAYIP